MYDIERHCWALAAVYIGRRLVVISNLKFDLVYKIYNSVRKRAVEHREKCILLIPCLTLPVQH